MNIIKKREGKNKKTTAQQYRTQKLSTKARYTGTPKNSISSQPVDVDHDTVVCVERLADDGRGIAIVQGKTVFVQGALVGEDVTVAVNKRAPKYIDARVHKVIKASPLRQTPPCPVFSRCGGCSVQYMPAAEQVAFKQHAVLSQLSRWSTITPDTLLPVLTDTEYGYRQRVRLAVDYTKAGELLLGFREADSHAIVNIDTCMVLSPNLQTVIPPLRQWLSQIKANLVSHIELVNTTEVVVANDGKQDQKGDKITGGSVGVIVRHTRPLTNADRQQLQHVLSAGQTAKITVNLWFQREKQGVLEDSNGAEVDPRLEYVLTLNAPIVDTLIADTSIVTPSQPNPIEASLSFRFHPQDFIQSNPFINQQMVQQTIALLAPKSHETVMDLYCGIGNFSLPLALHAKHVLAVEGVENMVVRASDNAQRNHIENITFITQDLSQPTLLRASVKAHRQQQGAGLSANSTTKKSGKKSVIDALLLDPPRGGAKAVCENIGELSPQRIVYVSCDSSTFTRDAGLLVDNGYRLSTLGIMDMFPQTSHVEIMALFTLESVVAGIADPSLKRSNKAHSSRTALTRSSQSATKPKRVRKLG
jgi:23S rRNA (uracil1939-C5)-methyltransferase